MASTVDPISFPFAAISVAIFTMLVVMIFPGASAELEEKVNNNFAAVESHAMLSSMFAGSTYESQEGIPLTDYHSISYLICGKEPEDDSSWWNPLDQPNIETGEPQTASYYEMYVSGREATVCEDHDNLWDTPAEGGLPENSRPHDYNTFIPVRGGDAVVIGVRSSAE